DERDRIPLVAPDFPVDQEILQLPGPRRPEGVEAVPRPPASNRQRQLEGAGRYPDFLAPGCPLPLTPGPALKSLCRNRDFRHLELDLTRNRQRNRERGPTADVRGPRSEVRRPTPEVRRPRSEVRRSRSAASGSEDDRVPRPDRVLSGQAHGGS